MEEEIILWSRLKSGDRQAFEYFFHFYYQDLYRYGSRFCGDQQQTEDEIQNLFLKIWTNREGLGDVKAVKTYLWTALRRQLISASEKNMRETSLKENNSYEQVFLLSVEEFIIKNEKKREQAERLKIVIQSLSERQKEVLYLKFYEGMSYEEIEQIMGVSQQTARNYLYLSLQKLRNIFSEEAPALLSTLMILLS